MGYLFQIPCHVADVDDIGVFSTDGKTVELHKRRGRTWSKMMMLMNKSNRTETWPSYGQSVNLAWLKICELWMNKQTNEWINEWNNKWKNKWMKMNVTRHDRWNEWRRQKRPFCIFQTFAWPISRPINQLTDRQIWSRSEVRGCT